MKKIIILCSLLVSAGLAEAQELTGRWYSSDSSRTYEIKQDANNNFEAILIASSRKKDTTGFAILKHLQYNSRKKRYEGVIYAVSDNQPAFVSIKFDKENSNTLVLTLSRMLGMNVRINWVRADLGL